MTEGINLNAFMHSVDIPAHETEWLQKTCEYTNPVVHIDKRTSISKQACALYMDYNYTIHRLTFYDELYKYLWC